LRAIAQFFKNIWRSVGPRISLLLGWFAYGLSFLARGRSHVVQSWPGDRDLDAARRVAIFMHYDGGGHIADFVEVYLREIAEAGFTILFISNSPRLTEEAVARLKPLCGLIVLRENVGRDFGAYKEAILMLRNRAELDVLMIANDSVYGPFHSLRELIDRVNFAEADVWSVTDNWERRYHLQSFFLLLNNRAVTSPAFNSFWHSVRNVQSKTFIVRQYEIGLTQALMRGGLRCRALFPYRDAVSALIRAIREQNALGNETLSLAQRDYLKHLFGMTQMGTPLNPTHYFWDYLVGKMGCPFIKRDLLRDNPCDVPFLQYWQDVVRSVSSYDTDLIVRHLEGSARHRFY
jgi:lipopolysaccharide biosynthesis protein